MQSRGGTGLFCFFFLDVCQLCTTHHSLACNKFTETECSFHRRLIWCTVLDGGTRDDDAHKDQSPAHSSMRPLGQYWANDRKPILVQLQKLHWKTLHKIPPHSQVCECAFAAPNFRDLVDSRQFFLNTLLTAGYLLPCCVYTLLAVEISQRRGFIWPFVFLDSRYDFGRTTHSRALQMPFFIFSLGGWMVFFALFFWMARIHTRELFRCCCWRSFFRGGFCDKNRIRTK